MSSYDGILNINKPQGWTSHDVVAKVRRLLGQRQVGHAGTLDPLATGVLLVCAGQATRVSEYLMDGQKVYRAVARLGVTTDTYDIDGEITSRSPVPALSRADLLAVLTSFIGALLQRPPAYSAIKQAGVPAYRKARRGEAVELPARPVTIHGIELLDVPGASEAPGTWGDQLTLEVTCDPGTYIRSLTHDLGQALGCGAVLIQLTRLRSGQFTVEDASDLDELIADAATGDLARHLHPLRAALYDLTAVPVDAAASQRLQHGQAIPCTENTQMTADWNRGFSRFVDQREKPAEASNPPSQQTICRADVGYALEADGTVRAILTYDAATSLWRPHKVFAT
jgi:tRNA pseudouridine55 synthase